MPDESVRELALKWRGDFHAAHILQIPTHCNRCHGHSWELLVEVTGEPHLQDSMVIDFAQISAVAKEFDHKTLVNSATAKREGGSTLITITVVGNKKLYTIPTSDILEIPGEPTCENLAHLIASRILRAALKKGRKVYQVKVELFETRKHSCISVVTPMTALKESK